MTGLDPNLDAALARLARRPTKLVATDYDGTLAPLVADPEKAFPASGVMEALERLARVPGLTVAIVSGRALASLDRLAAFPAQVVRVGSHGVEFDGPMGLSPEQQRAKERLRHELTEIAQQTPGALVEEKPAGFAFHVRQVAPESARRAWDQVEAGPAGAPDIFLRTGKMVLELAVVDGNKGAALLRLKERTRAQLALYVGDDVTDEEGFAALGPQDVTIKVGEGETRAGHRVNGPQDVIAVFGRLAQLCAESG